MSGDGAAGAVGAGAGVTVGATTTAGVGAAAGAGGRAVAQASRDRHQTVSESARRNDGFTFDLGAPPYTVRRACSDVWRRMSSRNTLAGGEHSSMAKAHEKKVPEARYLDIPIGPRLARALSLAWRARRPALLEGPTGIGKSEMVAAVARSLGIQTVVLDLSLLEPPDLVGLPVIDGGRTRYAPPAVLPTDGEGILMLEELNRAERYIQQPALQLLTARRLHEYTLPPGWSTCAAINPETGDYQVTPLDPALRARFLNFKVRAERASWLVWAEGHGVHHAIVDLVRAHDRSLDEVAPRTWSYASELLHTATAEELSDDTLMRDLLGGYLAPAWIEALLAGRARWRVEGAIDVGVAVERYHRESALQKTVRTMASEGRTDRLTQLADQLRALVGGPTLGVQVERGAFALEAFDALLDDLPGDHRERVQEAFGANPMSARVVPLKAEDVLRGFQGSAAHKTAAQWARDRRDRHKLLALVTSLAVQIEMHPDANALRKNTGAMVGLGHFLALFEAEPATAMGLLKVLKKRGITPIAPRPR